MVHIVRNLDELKTFLKSAGNKLVVVEFTAKWCGPCKRISPLIHAMSLQYQNVVFANVDVDEAQELAETFNIKAVPTFQLFKQTQASKNLDEFVSDWKPQLLEESPQIRIAPLVSLSSQVFEMCGADVKKLEAKIQELM